MKPRMGRPKVANPKNIDVKVRFDEETHNRLIKYCEKHNITRTDAIRAGINLLIKTDEK